MDTNTIIELFEELRKQLTSLSRRIDDRNISAPAPVTTDDKIARLLETAQFTRTNVERVRMELADRITTIGKETENHTEKKRPSLILRNPQPNGISTSSTSTPRGHYSIWRSLSS